MADAAAAEDATLFTGSAGMGLFEGLVLGFLRQLYPLSYSSFRVQLAAHRRAGLIVRHEPSGRWLGVFVRPVKPDEELEFIAEGAVGAVAIDSPLEVLKRAFDVLSASSGVYLSDSSVTWIGRRARGSNAHSSAPLLTPREREILALMAAGESNAEIAERLYVSLNTVRSHARAIYRKLEVSNRSKMLVKARHLGLIGD